MQQPQLPFELTADNTANDRTSIRKLTVSRSERAATILFENVVIRPEFNWRRKVGLSEAEYEAKLGIPELAEAIYLSNGPDDPIVGDLMKDGTFVITEGERRTRALAYLLRSDRETYPNGEPVNIVEVLINPKDTTELDRIRKIVTSQDKMPLTPIERAYGYLKLKEQYGLTNQAIADMFKVSRQSVDNYIIVTSFSKEEQDRIESGEENVTKAILMHRDKKKATHATVNLETGELEEQVIQTIPDLDNRIDDQSARLDAEAPKEPSDKPVKVVETKAADEEEFESHVTDPNYKEPSRKGNTQDALGKINASAQKTEAEMDIEQGIKMLDKLFKKLGDMPNHMKQHKDDMKGLLHNAQKLIIGGLDKIKRMPSSVEED